MILADMIGNGLLYGGTLWEFAVLGLSAMTICLAGVWFIIRQRTVRIYNWNGRRYCYLGRAGLWSNGGGYLVRIGERMADLSHTTLYQICPSKNFVRRNKYKELVLCAGKTQCMLPVEECMRQSVYFRG